MNVSIYIKSSFRGNPRGAGEAAAVIEFIDKQGKSHKRQQRTQIEADTKNALHLKILHRSDAGIIKALRYNRFY